MIAYVDNNLILWSEYLMCLLDFEGPVAISSQPPEVKTLHPLVMNAKRVVENLPLVRNVAIHPAIGAYTHN